MRILVVDDEPSMLDAVSTALRYEGHEVLEATNGLRAASAVRVSDVELVIIDVMLPDVPGTEVVRRLRAEGIELPILFISALDSVDDKVAGLGAGGDDYVTKPFALAEIVARVRALARRRHGFEAQPVLRFSDLEMDLASHQVHRGVAGVELSATEFSLLRLFLQNPRRVLSKAQILAEVWYPGYATDTNVVETYVSYLRKKLHGLGGPLIHTVRMAGYVLRED